MYVNIHIVVPFIIIARKTHCLNGNNINDNTNTQLVSASTHFT